MANEMVQAPNQLATLQGLLQLVGGGGQGMGTTTTTPGDIGPLQQLLAQLQGADYQGMLQQIFQQAGGAIPGLQAAYGNAVGARSGNNSATAAALQELLKATTIEAQGQLANQQLQNQQIQANAAGNIAQFTRGQTQQTKANTMTGSGLGDLAALLAVMKGAQVLTGSKDANEMLGKVTGLGTLQSPQSMAPVRDAAPVTASTQISSAPPVQQFDINSVLGGGGMSYAPGDSLSFPQNNYQKPNMSYADWYQPASINDIIGVEAPEMSYAPAEWFPQTDVMSYF